MPSMPVDPVFVPQKLAAREKHVRASRPAPSPLVARPFFFFFFSNY